MLLAAAKEGSGSATAEALSRACAGRAYYALFGELIEYVELKFGRRFEPPGVHAQLWRFLTSETHGGAFQEESIALRRLRTWREWADYDTERPFAVELASSSLSKARQMLAKKRARP